MTESRQEYREEATKDWATPCCPEAGAPNTDHCPHRTGRSLATAPVQYPEVCCRCGQHRVVCYRLQLDGHGPFHPARPRTPEPEGV